MNEERINELQNFTDEFNRMIEDAHIRYEKVRIAILIY